MCILCTKVYDLNLTRIDCNNCRRVTKIPKDLTKITYLRCQNTKIKKYHLH
jgi:hypothetical protein